MVGLMLELHLQVGCQEGDAAEGGLVGLPWVTRVEYLLGSLCAVVVHGCEPRPPGVHGLILSFDGATAQMQCVCYTRPRSPVLQDWRWFCLGLQVLLSHPLLPVSPLVVAPCSSGLDICPSFFTGITATHHPGASSDEPLPTHDTATDP